MIRKKSFLFILSILFVLGLSQAQEVLNYLEEGEKKFQEKDYSASIETYDQALADNAGDARAYQYRGRSHRRMNNLAAAFDDYNNSLNLNYNNASAFIGRGLTFIKFGNFEAALQDLQVALQINPGTTYLPDIYYNQAWMYQRLGQTDTALIIYEKVLKAQPNHEKAQVNHAFLLYQKDQVQEACAEWKKAESQGNEIARRNREKACKCCL
ncbi:MAG: tetratricopeptide repeat protein [Bacteroidota bacterium]